MASYVRQLKWGIPIFLQYLEDMGKASSISFLFKKQKVGFLQSY